VHKEREQGRVVGVEQRVLLGTEAQVQEARAAGGSAGTVNTS
jgi:hypothetical protein